MIDSITLLGSSSGRNAGDAALLTGIMDMIDSQCGKSITYDIPTIRPDFVRNNYDNLVRPVGMYPWQLAVRMLGVPTYRSVMRTDLSLIFDAILFDRSLWNPLFNFLSTLHFILRRAHQKGRRVGLFNVGVGPVQTKQGRRMLAELIECMDIITVRDKESAELLVDIGIDDSRIIQTADAALTVVGAPPERVNEIIKQLGFAETSDLFAVNINRYLATWSGAEHCNLQREEFLTAYANAINRFATETCVPVLFVATQHHDVAITRDLMARIDSSVQTAMLSNLDHHHREIIGVLGQVSLLFAMRLHAVILASSSCTPVTGLAYQPKVTSFFRQLGIEDRCLQFDQFDAETLYRHIRDGWEQRANIRGKLQQVIPRLKKRAFLAADLVRSLHLDEDLDRSIARAAAASREITNEPSSDEDKPRPSA